MKIALLYPPPWKIPAKGESIYPVGEGPPREFQPGDLDADFFQTPYGLFTLGAQALRAGHQVKVLNLSSFAWTNVEKILSTLQADVWGLSCWTANRRGVAFTAEKIKQLFPNSHVVVGGPHATPLAKEMLQHHRAIDTICVGESEETFLELLSRIEQQQSTKGIAGTWYRSEGKVLQGPEREAVRNLDQLASPHEYFDTHILMTSRGCPWACTFCGAEASWGRGFRARSVERVLDDLELALSRLPVRMIQIKDDTFTTNRKRVLELCRGMRKRNLRFLWSCDTRVDVLTEELLREMRLAGCERLSLGVESGAQAVLDAMDKKISPDEILKSTELARKYGIAVRYYMIVGARGETRSTIQETMEFLQRAKPHQYLFSCLSIYPGTKDFHDAVQAGLITSEAYFTGDFQEYKIPFDASPEDARYFGEWFEQHRGLKTVYEPSLGEFVAISERLGGKHAPAVLDVGAAYYREGDYDEAEEHFLQALELDHPTPGVLHNYLGCIAYHRRDLAGIDRWFTEGSNRDPQHAALLQNVLAVHQWLQDKGPEKDLPLNLQAYHGFELLERTQQPSLPGPLAPGWEVWKTAEKPKPIPPISPLEIASRKDLRRALPVLKRETM